MVADEYCKNRNWHDKDENARSNLRPGNALDVALKPGKIDGYGYGFGVVECERETVFIPGGYETENGCYSHAGCRVGQDDFVKCVKWTVAIDEGGFFIRPGYFVYESLHSARPRARD